MNIATKQQRLVDEILAEIDREAEITKRLFDIIPEDRLSWRPHPQARSLGELALHIAVTQGGVAKLTESDASEVNPPPDREAASRAEILAAFADSLKTAKEIIGATDDARVLAEWKYTRNGQTTAVRRGDFWRSILLNHYYHHRGQLSVYLRELNVKLPSIYGPSADTNAAG
jgi:uncharacterized damage-inducible protein DinB